MTYGDIRDYALSFLGIPYIWGGDDTILGFDCSGFVQEILLAFGAHPQPKTDLSAQELYNQLVKTGEYNKKYTGSLVFFGEKYNMISHVGLLISSDLMIEAGGGGRRTKTSGDAAEQNAFIRIRPVMSRSDIVCTVMPVYPYLMFK